MEEEVMVEKVKNTKTGRKTVNPSNTELLVESLSPVLGSNIISSTQSTTPTKSIKRRNSNIQTKRVKEDVDPGELVSAWHQMNKKYQNALDTLSKVADQLDELSKELETKFGIKVPTAKRLNNDASNRVVTTTPVQQNYEDYETESYQESNWTPPVQSTVSTGTVQNPNFIEQMRRDSSIGEISSDQSFAASIAAQFNNIMGSLK